MRILIVDDELELLELLSWSFETAGYKVFTAEEPSAAFSVLKSEEIDYVLSDLKMKTGTGVDLLELVFNSQIKIKAFFIMSGYTDIDSQELRDKGLTKVFNKPLSPNSVISFIETLD